MASSNIRVWQSVKVLEGKFKDQAGHVHGFTEAGKVVVCMDIDNKLHEFAESNLQVLGG